jgi:hypothetical protein
MKSYGLTDEVRALRERIRQGDAGPYRDQVLAHMKQTVREKLLVSNPSWLNRPDEQ